MYNRVQNQQDDPIADDFKFYGNYRGEVVDNKDPLEAGRVRVRIFGVFDEIPDEHLPWAIFLDPFMGGLSDIGSSIIPNIGSHVWCFFENGEHHNPVYFGGAPAIKDKGKNPDLPAESRNESDEALTEYKIFEGESADPIAGPEEVTHSNGQYPANKVVRTKQGIVVEIDDSEDNVRIRVKHPSGTQNEIDNDGNVYHENVKDETNLTKGNKKERTTGDQFETVMGNETTHNEKNVTSAIVGNWEVDTEGNVKLMAPNIQLGEDDAVEQSVLGKALEDWINNELIPWLNSHQHIGNLGSPVSAVVSPFQAGTAAPGAACWSKVNTNQ